MRLIIALSAILFLGPMLSVSRAAPPPNIRESVAVCDPNAPTRCLAPTAGGGLPGAGGGGSITGPLGTQTIPNSVAVTTADGTLVTLGLKADVASPCTVSSPTSCTAQQQFAEMSQLLNSILTAATSAVPCAVTTAAPTYTTGTTQAASCNTSGGLRVEGVVPVGAAAATPGPLSGSPLTITSTATQVAAARTGATGTGRTMLIIEQESASIALRCGPSASVLFAGGTGTSAGILLPATIGASLNLQTTSAYWCISSSTSGNVSVVELF